MNRLNQKATLWTTTVDGFGTPTFAAPIIIDCRWEDRTDRFLGRNGEERVSRSHVFVNRDMDIDDWLFLGESEAADPRTLGVAYPIQQFNKIPDLRALRTLRKAIL